MPQCKDREKSGIESHLLHTFISHKFCGITPKVYGQAFTVDFQSTANYPEKWHT